MGLAPSAPGGVRDFSKPSSQWLAENHLNKGWIPDSRCPEQRLVGMKFMVSGALLWV